ncbi:MAG TPA: methyltransferase [Gammaproteobacteria bacterium]
MSLQSRQFSSAPSTWSQRLSRLDALLVETQWLWRPAPFKEVRPAWCEQLPQLCAALLALDEPSLAALAASDEQRQAWLQGYLPQLQELAELVALPATTALPAFEVGPHFGWEIPGRKWQQITTFAAALGTVRAPLLEWCGGKGHLGRLLAMQWRQPVTTLELDDTLCSEGARLAQRAHIAQQFHQGDALSRQAAQLLPARHAVALHACGELHRTLLREAVAAQLPALDLAPCCYAHLAAEQYRPFSAQTSLQVSHDDLRLAVTETVTAAPREVRQRDKEMAWKLGFDALRRELLGIAHYLPLRPIDKGWLKLDFAGFCRQLARREGVPLPAEVDWAAYQQTGWQRQYDSQRLTLVRHAFRRALELWLVLDMAVYLETHGYAVGLVTFCERSVTPRNILLSARRSK